MPLFGKSDHYSDNPQIREVEKRVAKEAHADEKNFKHAINDLSTADKAHTKSIKAADKARHSLDQAVGKEHKAAKALNRAVHNHDMAVSNEQNAEKTVQIKHQHEARLEQDLALKRQHLEELRQKKDHNDHVRESKLAELHAREAAAVDARHSFDNPADPANANGVNPVGGPGTVPIPSGADTGEPLKETH